ncbi:TIGR02757 family protein [Thermophagus sp. OGC60D27]|uniref:TIGR02757 family protein n=1 Tax=Thermophagus sp. OGC60D27 TaxID=3458415 RepID=UPI0040379485
MLNKKELKEFLDSKANYYQSRWFIDEDPVQIPHLFQLKEDIEIAGFLTAILSWGKRSMILTKCLDLMKRMDMAPYEFICNATEREVDRLTGFVYRTFNDVDAHYFLKALHRIYIDHEGLEKVFFAGYSSNGMVGAIDHFRKLFFSFQPSLRTEKHVANVAKNASAKRINMYLRWMVRRDSPVDFGLWSSMDPAHLLIPLDIHVGRVARSLGMLNRKSNDLKSVMELTQQLREFRPHDPVFYDYALFGLGVYEKF